MSITANSLAFIALYADAVVFSEAYFYLLLTLGLLFQQSKPYFYKMHWFLAYVCMYLCVCIHTETECLQSALDRRQIYTCMSCRCYVKGNEKHRSIVKHYMLRTS